MDELVGNPEHGNSTYCFAKHNEIYLVYLPNGGSKSLDLRQATGEFDVHWYNPRTGGPLQVGSVAGVSGQSEAELGNPPTDEDEDWLIVIRNNDL